MKVLIDACVLYPTVMREIVLGVARLGRFSPIWSPRILEEWARAAAKSGPEMEAVARGEIAVLRAAWPKAEVAPDLARAAKMVLPDPNDVHVLAAAVGAGAKEIMTLNIKDFPTRTLAQYGIVRRDPDTFLIEQYHADPEGVAAQVEAVRATAERLSGEAQPVRPLLKRARLPRLGKALGEKFS